MRGERANVRHGPVIWLANTNKAIFYMGHYLQHKNDLGVIARVYDELSFWSSRFGALLFDNLELRKGMNILDVGCGTGFPLFHLVHLHGSSCRVTGIDVWAEGLERAQLKLETYGLPNVWIVRADAAAMPFAEGEFDLIVLNLIVNNLADPATALAECFRVAKPGARIALTSNLVGHMHTFYGIFREALLQLDLAQRLGRLEANEAHRGTKETMCSLLDRSGFRVAKVVEDSFQMRFLDSSALFNHPLIKFGFLDGWRCIVEQSEEHALFSALEVKLDALAERDGELRMIIPMLYVEAEKPEDK
ncbi:MAG TPA: class I SAM-dependent methyltransferase [Chloroflexia bacterium]|nr:class I SAM-dependent methyltransferase [Chloroflexia bacterium]